MRAASPSGEVDVDLATHRFLVVDVETTGWAPPSAAITEIAGVLVSDESRDEAFSTLVNPGMLIPREITALTGITDAMVVGAPPVGAVLDDFLAAAEGTVIVGHNLGFDLSFLDAALASSRRAPLANARLDTLVLSRLALRGRVPDFRLVTLARYLGLPNQPAHRAMSDAHATADLLLALCALDRAQEVRPASAGRTGW